MKREYYAIIGIVLVLMLVHIEISLNTNYAPENVLIKVNDPDGNTEENADCVGDIISDQINVEKKPLRNLESLYDFIDRKTLYISEDKGFYLFETDFKDYSEEFEIRIVCYSPGFKGVSYTIITDKNNNCEVKLEGKLVVC